ncbi:uncharacterized protein LOC113227839 [Hyposmocoma kahamanoa]|uniref:uncharacterized protein LOC113227839 n=1 Tax=Hyposmocoma kahamanoa TaxID=1477025 RepID=UPI000E6D9842|nr:uncharacterized protein LOC113227839 [Hyposmocoma kahamanoa]
MRMTQLIGMPLTPQEDYLLNQAFTISRRRFSPERSNSDRCTRIPRSRMSLRNQSKENIVSKDIFGFKPFASKKIIIMTSREGNITCQYSLPHKFGSTPMNPGDYNFAVDIIEDVLDKVNEMIVDEFTEKHDGDTEKNGFEVIAFPSNLNDEGNKSDSFGPNEEQALETNLSVEDGLEDVIQIINDEETTYSEGLIGDKHLTEAMFQENEFALVTVEEPPIVLTAKFSSESRSSRKSALNEELKDNLDVTECSDVTTDTNKTHETKSSSIISDLRTQIMPDDGEINVESLLNYLRKKNAAYDVLSEADID